VAVAVAMVATEVSPVTAAMLRVAAPAMADMGPSEVEADPVAHQDPMASTATAAMVATQPLVAAPVAAAWVLLATTAQRD
jgi:hypothetical protein